MSKHPWPKSARVTAPLMPAPRILCWECAEKDKQIARLMAELRRAMAELIDRAADLAVAEGPEIA